MSVELMSFVGNTTGHFDYLLRLRVGRKKRWFFDHHDQFVVGVFRKVLRMSLLKKLAYVIDVFC